VTASPGTLVRSWGNYPDFPQTAHACFWRDRLDDTWRDVATAHGSTLAHGNGRSYGDACLAASDHVLHMRGLDRLIAADWTTGVLRAEAGVTLAEILVAAIPRGWFLPVTPGTKFATLGGAIANDVHGKNHHRRGTFGRHVRRFSLLRSEEGQLLCAPDENVELFDATIGGLGLTGIIEWAEIQLVPIPSTDIVGVSERFGALPEFFAISDELDRRHEFCVAWIDCVASGPATGRGVYVAGDFAADGTLALDAPKRLAMPLSPPFSLVGPRFVRAFNALYWHKAPAGRRPMRVGYGPFFYPLDGILHWNRIYGRRGFQQYQCLVPPVDAEAAIAALLRETGRAGAGSFLAVLKRCGDLSSPGWMSFPRAGTTLALDFPQSPALDATLFPRLDAIVREAGGCLNPSKDAHMRGADFRRAYARWRDVERLRDRTLMSRFWRRVIEDEPSVGAS
jgi:FAD/FMN-containing dehydrogenase